MESNPKTDVSLSSPSPNPSNHQPLLRPSRSKAFKREERRKRKERKRQERLVLELARWEPLGAPPRAVAPSPSRVPPDDTPWTCDAPPPPDPASSAVWSWGPRAEPPPEVPKPPAAARCPQAAAASACRSFFERHFDDNDEGEEEEEEEMARFFEDLLASDADLSGLYEAKREAGRFLCPVCKGVGARAGKSFVGCAALVHHAESITRTRWRLAHRAFAGAVSRLLGWGAGRTTHSPSHSLMLVDSDVDGV